MAPYDRHKECNDAQGHSRRKELGAFGLGNSLAKQASTCLFFEPCPLTSLLARIARTHAIDASKITLNCSF